MQYILAALAGRTTCILLLLSNTTVGSVAGSRSDFSFITVKAGSDKRALYIANPSFVNKSNRSTCVTSDKDPIESKPTLPQTFR